MIDTKNIKLVIFDLQQTLLDDYQAHIDAYIKILNEMGIKDIDENLEEIKRLWGKRVIDVFKQLFSDKFSEKELENYVIKRDQYYIKILSQKPIKICPGANEILEFFKAKNIMMTVASGTRREAVSIGLKQSNFNKYIDFFIGAEDVKKGKPAPDQYINAPRHFKISPEFCLAIGDSFLDMESAHNGGLITVGIATGFTSREDLEKSNADYVFDDLIELRKNLN